MYGGWEVGVGGGGAGGGDEEECYRGEKIADAEVSYQ